MGLPWAFTGDFLKAKTDAGHSGATKMEEGKGCGICSLFHGLDRQTLGVRHEGLAAILGRTARSATR